MRNKNGEIHVVTIACDSPFPYIDEYFEYLDESDFPKIENQELLLCNHLQNQVKNENKNYDITIQDFTQNAFGKSCDYLQNELVENVNINPEYIILDVREKYMFEHFHIPCSQNVPYFECQKLLSSFAQNFKGKKVIVVCQKGYKSYDIAQKFDEFDVDAYSLSGGTILWSYYNLPRVRSKQCLLQH